MAEREDLFAAYAPRGIPLHGLVGDGCTCGSPTCTNAGKHPVLPKWPGRSQEENAACLGRNESYNLGIRCGSGLVVLDIDPRHGGTDSLRALVAQHGPLPHGPLVYTGGGGVHLYFSGAHNLPSYDLAPGVEVKARGSQVVAPPSVHASGRIYAWSPSRPLVATPPQLPEWIAAAAPQATGRSFDLPRSPLDKIAPSTYFRVLTGQQVGHNGKTYCPIPGHTERTPSCHVYDREDGKNGGWYCFGCRRGGGIYDLAALTLGEPVPLRGSSFMAVVDYLNLRFKDLI